MLYDTHCHPYLAKQKSQDTILENFFTDKNRYLNTIGIDISSSSTSIEIAKKYPQAFATIGIHPTHTLDYKNIIDETIQKLEALYHSSPENIVAIGETGLDYYWLETLAKEHNVGKKDIISLQKKIFKKQIQLSQNLGIPLVIHNRESGEDIYEILVQESCNNFVFHCFSENLAFAQKLLKFAPDCKLGFGGITTFKNAKSIHEVVKHIPLRNIIIETDSPYLTPTPHRGKQENEPLYTQYILDTIIDLRDESPQEVQETIFQNSIDFFLTK